ncbi:sugar transferase [Formosa sp. S-31]|uniref:sugar transferase n=1 Tax=Formosa sp. S-31 TaxID=2790949 RepID=UPI003EBC580C
MYKSFFKRFIDFIIAVSGFITLLPVFIILTLILLITNQGKPFFTQKRPGKNEKIFKIIKFKSMTDAKDKNGNLLPESKRITKIGKFIRKTSLDEIPQLINIIIGDMSIIGPRPLLVNYLQYYNTIQKHRHDIRPGITGWAQVNGRNTLNWEDRFNHDVWYVDNLSLKLDLKIIFLTIKKVLKREDIYDLEQVELKEFKGTTNNL